MSGFYHGMWLFCISLFFLSIQALSQPPEIKIPDTPSGRILEALVETLNSGEEAAWREFIEQRWVPRDKEGINEQRMGFFRQVYEDVGGFDIYEISSTDDLVISVLAKARRDDGPFKWLSVEVRVDSLPPHKLDRLSAQPAEDPELEYPEGPLTKAKITAFLDQYLDKLTAEDRFSGTVLVAKDGKPIYKKAFGEACKRYGVPNKIDTKFNLGSMNKMFTSVAIMQLVEQGKLDLDRPVGTWLPDLPRKDIAEKVTIDHLLSHRSGMQDYWDEMFDTTFWELKTVDGLARLIFDDSLLFEPGSDFHYSNSGPIVLGMVIEKVTGMSYYDYVQKYVHQPAGMINTACYEVDLPTPNLAIGYTRMNMAGERSDEWHNNFFLHAVKGGPAGGGYSTVEDLLAFDIALRNNTLIGAESFTTMITPKSEMGPDEGYGYLFQNKTVNGQRIVGHGGGAPGINAVLDIYLDSGYTVAVMANYDQAAGTVARTLEKLLTRTGE